MNYIKPLQSDKADMVEQAEIALEKLDDLRAYLHSSKFRCEGALEGYVNVRDVLMRLEGPILNLISLLDNR